MTKSLLAPAPINADVPPEWGRHAEWIDVMAQNMMFAANELRPIQVGTSCSQIVTVSFVWEGPSKLRRYDETAD